MEENLPQGMNITYPLRWSVTQDVPGNLVCLDPDNPESDTNLGAAQ
jgi:hypothetical protein